MPATSANHKVLVGAGYRQARSEAGKTLLVVFDPVARRASQIPRSAWLMFEWRPE